MVLVKCKDLPSSGAKFFTPILEALYISSEAIKVKVVVSLCNNVLVNGDV